MTIRMKAHPVEISDENPTLVDLYRKIRELVPPEREFKRSNHIIYWRYTMERFVPIYSQMSYNTFLSLTLSKKVYVVGKDLTPAWTATKHPICIHRGRSSDTDLLTHLITADTSAHERVGNSVADGHNMQLVANLLKGVPKFRENVDEGAKGKKKPGSKGKEKKSGSKGKGKK